MRFKQTNLQQNKHGGRAGPRGAFLGGDLRLRGDAMLYYTIIYYAIIYDTILYYVLLQYTTLCHTITYYKILCYDLL